MIKSLGRTDGEKKKEKKNKDYKQLSLFRHTE